MADTPFRTSPSAIARYFFHDCERFLRFHAASPERQRKEGIPKREFEHSALAQSLLDSGNSWGECVVQQHLAERTVVARGDGPLHARRFGLDETVELLRTVEPGKFIYQPMLRLSGEFYRRHGIDVNLLTINDNHPDLIEVRRDASGLRVLRVIGLKRGDALELTHRVQVLLYALELDSILQDENIDDARIDLELGGVWLRPQSEPTMFRMGDFRPHFDSFLSRDLPRIFESSPGNARWHVHGRCEGCEFYHYCWSEMQRSDDLSRMANLTSSGKEFLRKRANVKTTAELGHFLEQPEADEVLARCASLAGQRPKLKQQVAAMQEDTPQPYGAASPTISRGENVGLFLTLQREPLGDSIYLAGLHATIRKDLRKTVLSDAVRSRLFDGNKSTPVVMVAESPEKVQDLRREFVTMLHAIVVDIHQFNQARDWKDQLSLQSYVLVEQERSLLVSWLLETLNDPELAEKASTLLFHFQAPELLAANEHPDREVPFPLVALLNSMEQVLAMPCEVSYTLPETLEAVRSRFKLKRNDYYQFPLGHAMRAESIHAVWYRDKKENLEGISEQAQARLHGLASLLQGIRQYAQESLFTWSAKFKLPAEQEYPDPYLSRLAFFARYESLLRCLEVRQTRCEPREVQLMLGQVVELEAQTDGSFLIVQGSAKIEPGGYPDWLLVTDSETGRRAQLEYRDYACRSHMWQGKKQTDLALVGVREVSRDETDSPICATLKYHRPFDGDEPKAGQRLLLQPRFTDFTTDSVVEFLQTGGMEAHGLFLRLLRNPVEASQPLKLPKQILRDAADAATVFSLTEKQTQAFRQIGQRRVVPVWGPPGTGKTHFLASVILALASAHARASKPFRVLVTAFTHAAIENLLKKVATLRGVVPNADALAVGKAKRWQSVGDSDIDVVNESELASWLADNQQAIIGATVYSCLKKYDELPKFDLVVVDEASQVRVPEASVPVSLAGAQGRLILAGDHLQLPPIVVGTYPDAPPDEPALHRSIFEVVVSRYIESDADDSFIQKLTDNFRMNDVLTSVSAHLLYGNEYRSFDPSVATRRLRLIPERSLTEFVEACLDPDFPLVICVLDGVWAARENPVEARLAAQIVTGLRSTLCQADGSLYSDDAAFFRDGVFVVSPHRVQNRLILQELRMQRTWEHTPFVDTVDKVQGQEADAVVVSYGVSDPEYAMKEADFIYGLNRLNVTLTRARSKCIVCLPRPLLDAPPQVLDEPEAARGLGYMRALLDAVRSSGDEHSFELEDGTRATVYRANRCVNAIEADEKKTENAEDENAVATSSSKITRQLVRRSAEMNFPPHPALSPAIPAAQGGGEGKDESAGRQKAELESMTDAGTTQSPQARNIEAKRQSQPKKREPAQTQNRIDSSHDKSPSPNIASPNRDSLLTGLNEQQRQSATSGHDPLLIVAGAGTGKTTTLVHRVAWLISQGIAPHRILMLTFTRRAASQMLDRVGHVLGESDIGRQVWGGTFHGIGMRLLRSYGKAIGINQQFTIHDQGDAEDLMASLLKEMETGKNKKNFPKKRTCMSIHSYGLNAQVSLADVLHGTQFEQYKPHSKILESLFDSYVKRKAELNVFDYDDLLVKWCELLEHDEAGPMIRERFDSVLVDEYQDTNRLQARLLMGLCPDGQGLTVVGDDAQSIYSFRAADVRNILDFPKTFPTAKVTTLEQNYRSNSSILEATNQVIGPAKDRYTKELWSQREGGWRPQLITCDNEHDQVEFVVDRILEHQRQGIPLSQQAVLFRAAQHSILLEGELARRDLEFVKYGGLKFVEAAHVKDLMSFLRLAENPRDIVAGQRLLCLFSGIGPKKASELLRTLGESDGQFIKWNDVAVPAKSKEIWPRVVELMRKLTADDKLLKDLPGQVRLIKNLYEPILETNFDNSVQRMADLEQLIELAKRFDDRSSFLSDLAVDPPASTAELPRGQRSENVLVLSTLHSAKGLEWKVVYVLHASDGKIPSERSFFNEDQLEEERRMFYVALTRAADCLYVCHPKRESSLYGSSWGDSRGSFYESTRLTRFITSQAKAAFECQTAAGFKEPKVTTAPNPTAPKPTAPKPTAPKPTAPKPTVRRKSRARSAKSQN